MNRRASLRAIIASCLAALPFFALPLAPTQAQPQAQPTSTSNSSSLRRIPKQIWVRWKSQKAPLVLARGQNPAAWQQSELVAQLQTQLPGARVARHFAGTGWSLVRLPSTLSDEAARARLAASLGAANISFNFFRHASKTPNDPSYAAQWQWPQIKAPAAWDLQTNAATVVVAVLDGGADLTHPDLVANLWKNSKEIAGNGLDDDKNGYTDDFDGFNPLNPGQPPQDEDGHGTHVTGLVGAVGNNSKNVTGVCWNIKILPIKFLDASGNGADNDAIAGIEYAVKLKQSGVNVRALSCSWGGADDNPALKAAFDLAEKAGLLSICAAGNSGTGRNTDSLPEFPASYTFNSIISVAASTPGDSLAGFSNFGAQSVDLVAPGTNILSLARGGGEIEISGTSMSTPIVTGAAALLSARDATLSATAIKTRLLQTVDISASLQGKMVSGGRLNLARALSNAIYSVSGRVIRPRGLLRLPLAGALVKAGILTTSTDKDGFYRFSEVSPGNITVSASLSGYTFAPITVSLPRAAGNNGAPNAVLDFIAQTSPTRTYTLSGTALNASGAVQKDVSIFLEGMPNAVALTDAAGKYIVRDRAAGTYKLTASSGGNLVWKATPLSIVLPVGSGIGAPNGIVNFSATVPDTAAPQVVIKTPQNGATLTPGSLVATGTASDATGLAQLYFRLTRTIGTDSLFYDWTSKTWTNNAAAPGIKGVQNVSGKAVNWSRTLPSLVVASYSLRVWGRDSLGNESTGEADALSSWTVASSTAATRTGASAGSS